ncbi:SH3 and multiple ankyrin repeat domains protein 3, partial [Dryobates pubescens]
AETPIEEFTPTPAFPALQYLESVDVEGVAWRAGLRTGDFLIEVRPPAGHWPWGAGGWLGLRKEGGNQVDPLLMERWMGIKRIMSGWKGGRESRGSCLGRKEGGNQVDPLLMERWMGIKRIMSGWKGGRESRGSCLGRKEGGNQVDPLLMERAWACSLLLNQSQPGSPTAWADLSPPTLSPCEEQPCAGWTPLVGHSWCWTVLVGHLWLDTLGGTLLVGHSWLGTLGGTVLVGHSWLPEHRASSQPCPSWGLFTAGPSAWWCGPPLGGPSSGCRDGGLEAKLHGLPQVISAAEMYDQARSSIPYPERQKRARSMIILQDSSHLPVEPTEIPRPGPSATPPEKLKRKGRVIDNPYANMGQFNVSLFAPTKPQRKKSPLVKQLQVEDAQERAALAITGGFSREPSPPRRGHRLGTGGAVEYQHHAGMAPVEAAGIPFATTIAGVMKDRDRRLDERRKSTVFLSVGAIEGTPPSSEMPSLQQSRSIDERLLGSRDVLLPSPVSALKPLISSSSPSPSPSSTFIHPLTGKPLDPNSPLALALAARERALSSQVPSRSPTPIHSPDSDRAVPLFVDIQTKEPERVELEALVSPAYSPGGKGVIIGTDLSPLAPTKSPWGTPSTLRKDIEARAEAASKEEKKQEDKKSMIISIVDTSQQKTAAATTPSGKPSEAPVGPESAADSGVEEVDTRSSSDHHLETTSTISTVSSMSTLSSESGEPTDTYTSFADGQTFILEKPPVPPKPKLKSQLSKGPVTFRDPLLKQSSDSELISQQHAATLASASIGRPRYLFQRRSKLWGDPMESSSSSSSRPVHGADDDKPTVISELSSRLQQLNKDSRSLGEEPTGSTLDPGKKSPVVAAR